MNKFSVGRNSDSVLAIPGILSQQWKPRIKVVIGKAWPKQAPDGRAYFKMQLDGFVTPSGKALYAKAWSRKQEPDVFDMYVDDRDIPVVNLCPLLGRNSITPSNIESGAMG